METKQPNLDPKQDHAKDVMPTMEWTLLIEVEIELKASEAFTKDPKWKNFKYARL